MVIEPPQESKHFLALEFWQGDTLVTSHYALLNRVSLSVPVSPDGAWSQAPLGTRFMD